MNIFHLQRSLCMIGKAIFQTNQRSSIGSFNIISHELILLFKTRREICHEDFSLTKIIRQSYTGHVTN